MRKKTTIQLFTSLFIVVTSFFVTFAQKSSPLVLWYNKPAVVWNEALPLGNGRLGAMVFGDPHTETIQLNEITFWSGGPCRNDNPDALEALPRIRQLIFERKYKEAEALVNEKVKSKQLQGAKYQPIGYVRLTFEGHDSYTNYRRELNLERAVCTITYSHNGVTYTREMFASQPDQVIVFRLRASERGALTFTATTDGPLQKTKSTLDSTTLELTGLSSTHEGVVGQVKFSARTRILHLGGTLTLTDTSIIVRNADEAVLFISIATNFVDYKTLGADEKELCNSYLQSAVRKSYQQLLSDHVAAYQKYFQRVSLVLGNSSFSHLPTDERVRNFSQTHDQELVALYFQFGRYLLISSSQPKGQPATLQGLWNDRVSPPWDSKYTININTEMNYWPAEKCNLPEMHEPLLQMIRELAEAGEQTARTMYGCDGWVTHHNTDLWRTCGVVDGAVWGMWPMGSAWLAQHLWEKYLYSGDREYLASVYPVLKSACEFYKDFLIEEPTHGWLVVSPSLSPENKHPFGTSICAGTTMDNQILFDLFSKTIRAAKILCIDTILQKEYTTILRRLPPMHIGRFGQLQEWLEDWDNPNDKHRHVSHLYGLFPSNQISPYRTPELFGAARTSLVHRGDVSTGWSMGWKVNLWARLLDGDHALKLITDQLTLVDPENPKSGGTFPNLFDSHPPFQIDGNFGCTSGIAEMLVQTHDGAIHLLPALPGEWKCGEIHGIRAYGGFEVSCSWENGEIQKVVLTSTLGGTCRIRTPQELVRTDGGILLPAEGANPNTFFETPILPSPVIADPTKCAPVSLKQTFLYDLPTEPGGTYTLVKKN